MGMNGTPLLAAAGKVHRWQPVPEGAVYLLRVPSVDDRTEWQRMIDLRGGRQVFPAMLVDEVERAVTALLPDGDDPLRALHLATVEAYRGRMDEAAALIRAQHFDPTVNLEGVPALLAPSPEFEELLEAIRPGWPAYDRLVADRKAWPKIAGVAAARLFLTGWEGEGLPPFQKGLSGGAGEASVAALPPFVIEALAWEIDRLSAWDWRTLGNWSAGSGTRPGPQPSDSTATPPGSAPPATAGT